MAPLRARPGPSVGLGMEGCRCFDSSPRYKPRFKGRRLSQERTYLPDTCAASARIANGKSGWHWGPGPAPSATMELQRHGGSLARACRTTLICVVVPLLALHSGVAQGVRPDYPSTQIFAAAVQQDYGLRKSVALVERFDMRSVGERCGTGFGVNRDDEKLFIEQMAKSIAATLKSEMSALETYSFMVVSRIAALRGKRVLECLFFHENGTFRVIHLTLQETAPGKIHFVDFSALGFPRQFTQSMRERLLFTGVPHFGLLTDAESHIERAMRSQIPRANAVFQALGEKDYDQAFTHLASLPPEARVLPIWRELRNRLMWMGSNLARNHFEKEQAKNPTYEDEFDRYTAISRGKDLTATLAALDQALDSAHQLPFLRLVKVENLIELQKLDEASRLAEHLRELNPLLMGAHLAVIRIAFIARDESRAIQNLERASLIWKPEDLIRFLAQDPRAGIWRDTPRFKQWIEQSTTHAGVKDPPSPSSSP